MEDICKLYNEIDAILFAQIIFASETVLAEHGVEKPFDTERIQTTLADQDFRRERHFQEIAEIFRRHLGAERVRLSDVDE